jgi:hypothetical protein
VRRLAVQLQGAKISCAVGLQQEHTALTGQGHEKWLIVEMQRFPHVYSSVLKLF